MNVHEESAARLAALDQRYTTGRRAIVDALANADRPLTVPEMVATATRNAIPQSSAYRNLTVLIEANVVHRVAGTDEFARYELAEELAGHHHHLMCGHCGTVMDIAADAKLERALVDAAKAAAEQRGFEVTGHRIDLLGLCSACR